MTETTATSRATGAVAAGLATIADDGTVLDTWFPAPELVAAPGPAGTERLTADQAAELLGDAAPKALGPDPRRGVEVVAVRTVIASTDDKPLDAHDAYLRLHLLSHRLVKPNGQNLEGIFGLLANVAWTSIGPVPAGNIERARLAARAEGLHLSVYGVDKFPRMTDYVVPMRRPHRRRRPRAPRRPPRVRHDRDARGLLQLQQPARWAPPWSRAASARASSSATAPTSAAAPRSWAPSPAAASPSSPSASAASWAPRASIGISLGDDCVVEVNLYVTAGTRVCLPDETIVKAKELSGADNLLFRRNSITGAVEVLQRTGSWGGLNEILHSHN